jgi:hypothetical protein
MSGIALHEIESELGLIDLDRLVIDGEYRRAVMLRLRSEAEDAARRDASTAVEPEPDKD